MFELLKKNYTEINRRQLGLTVTVGYKLDNFPFSFSLSEKVVVNLIARGSAAELNPKGLKSVAASCNNS